MCCQTEPTRGAATRAQVRCCGACQPRALMQFGASEGVAEVSRRFEAFCDRQPYSAARLRLWDEVQAFKVRLEHSSVL